MLVPALSISLNKAAAAPRWVSWPEEAGDGAWIGGGEVVQVQGEGVVQTLH